MNRKLKRIITFFMSFIIIMNLTTVSFAAENTSDLTVQNLQTLSTYAVMQGSGESAYQYSNLTLQIGEDETQMNFCWYSDSTVTDCYVQIALKSAMIGTEFPISSATSFSGITAVPVNNTENISNEVTVTGLAASTEYVYRVGDGTSFATPNTFKTQNSFSYNAILVGDPQIGCTNISTDTAGWQTTLKKALKAFPNTSFILSAGDQVETKTSEAQYAGLFSASELLSTPFVSTIGNHDNGSLYKYHYNAPNESTVYGTTDAGGDYWFEYGNTLYMVLNSNNKSATSHDTFIDNAIAEAGGDIQWKIVMFHHSIYSSASHSSDGDILSRRSDLYPIFDKYDIDVVLMGHDHDYARSYQMLGDMVQKNQTVDDHGRAVNPSGTLYVTANSASGSKYYELVNEQHGYEAYRWQGHTPSYSNITVTNDTFTITTFRTDTGDVIDTYSIYKDDVLKAKHPVKQKVNVGASTEVAASDISEGSDGNELTITAITTGPDSSVAMASLSNGKVIITGISAGSTSATVTVSDGTDVVDVEVPIETIKEHDLYFGMDIRSGEFKNESGSDVFNTSYSTNSAAGYKFEKDDELNQNVLCWPESGNLVINSLNLKPLSNQFTVEAYVKIPSELSISNSGSLTAYDVFQFDSQNINLVGVSGGTYFGAGRCTQGDADAYIGKSLPTDQWIHLLCTAKEGKQTLYVNGEMFLSDAFTGLNITSNYQDELVLGSTSVGRSGLIKYAYLRIYSDFINDEPEAQTMYQDMKNSFPPDDIVIDTAEINGVEIPVTGAAPTATIADTTEYTATISWLPADAAFSADMVYQATITITPKTGYTLSGVTENFFTVAGASSASNAAESGVITAEFPKTNVATLQKIDITKAADKLEYIVGESLDITGIVVTGTYNDKTTKEEAVTLSNVTGFDSSVPVESQTLTVTVKEKTTTYTVAIKEEPAEPVSAVISPTAVTYDLNKPVDLSTTIIWNSAQTITAVQCGTDEFTSNDIYAVSGSAIAVSGSALIIKSDYLLNQGFSQGDTATFNISFDNSNMASLSVNIVNSYILSNNSALSNLTVGGITIKDFAAEITEYSLELPYGAKPGSAEATVAAVANDLKAEVSITQAASLPGSAIITVTAEDKITTKTYTVTLTTREPSKPTYNLKISAGAGGSITAGNSGAYAEGTVINVSAKASSNYSFSNWSSSNGGSFGNVYDANTTFTMPAQEAVLTASFIYSGSSNPESDNTNGNNNNESTSDAKESDNKPAIKDSQLSGWEAIENYIENGEDEKLVVEMQGNTSVPGSLFETIKGRDIPVTFVVADGIEWIINGKDILEEDKEQTEGKDIDLKVTKNTDAIPSDVIDDLLQSDETESSETQNDKTAIQISLSYEGNFGFTATLRIDLDSSNAGRVANLFYYNPVSGQLELQGVGTVDANGYVSFEFTHASDYVILMDNGNVLKAEMEGITVTPQDNLLYVDGTIGKKTNLTIEYPETLKVLIENGICTPKVTYQSEDKNIALVMTNGKITARNEGETTITTIITINGETRSFRTNIIIKKAYFEIVQSKDTMKIGQSYVFKAVGYGIDASKVIWKTAKKSIVVINQTTGKAQAKTAGVDYVVAKVGKISAKIKVIVK